MVWSGSLEHHLAEAHSYVGIMSCGLQKNMDGSDMETVVVQTQSGSLMVVNLSKEMVKNNRTFSIPTDRGEEVFVLNPAPSNQLQKSKDGISCDSLPFEAPESLGTVHEAASVAKDHTETRSDQTVDSDEPDDKIGEYILYYCKSCIFHSPLRSDLVAHVSSDQCQDVDASVSVSSTLALAALEAIEHNYATSDGDLGADSDAACGTALHRFPLTDRDSSLKCQVCPHTHICSRTELSEHELCHTASGQADLFACYICQIRAQRGRPFIINGDWQKTRAHLSRVHNVDFNLACSYCGSKFSDHESFEGHLRVHYEQCQHESCSYATDNIDDLEIHLKCHSSSTDRSFQCTVCQFRDRRDPRDWDLMHDHVATAHPTVLQPRYRCRRCGQGFQQQGLYDAHHRECTRVHVQCEQCGQVVLISQLKQHMASQNQCLPLAGKRVKEGEPTVGSSVLDRRENVSKESYLPMPHSVTQLNSEDHESSVTCVKDGKKDLSENQVNTRDRSIVKPKRLHDYVTGKGNVEVRITRNVAAPTSPKYRGELSDIPLEPVRCQHCYKVFANEHRLTKHCQRSHSANKPETVVCPKCHRSFRNNTQRRNHIRQVHEGKKRKQSSAVVKADKMYHQCNQCDYLTPEKWRLDTHQQAVHQGLLPYQCEVCDYRTKESSDLHRHRTKHLGIKKFCCERCTYKTDQRWLLVKHCLGHHGIQMATISRNTQGCAFSLRRQARNAKPTKEQVTVPLSMMQKAPTEIFMVPATRNTGDRAQASPAAEQSHIVQGVLMEGPETFMLSEDARGGETLVPELAPSPRTSGEAYFVLPDIVKGFEETFIVSDDTFVVSDTEGEGLYLAPSELTREVFVQPQDHPGMSQVLLPSDQGETDQSALLMDTSTGIFNV